MVAKPMKRDCKAKSTISKGELSPQKQSVEPKLAVSGGSEAEKSPKCEVAKPRRSSARIKNMQKPDYKGPEKLPDENESSKKRKRNGYSRKSEESKFGKEEKVVPESLGLREAVAAGGAVKESGGGDIVSEVAPDNVVKKSEYAKVKDTLRLFNKHYLHFVQEEEKRCSEVKNVKKKSKKGKSNDQESKGKAKRPDLKASPKKQVESHDEEKGKAKRPDLKAISKMIETNTILYPKKQMGEIPGISVGHQFLSRAEMVVLGFHSHWLNGIDYMGLSYTKEYPNFRFPVAVAIVLSGMYEDDLDNADDVVYTGQGGHDLLGSKRQIADQKMLRGNLALKNAIDQQVAVRVVRGHMSSSSYTGRVYTYDGLYQVVEYWADKGNSGFTVFKYRLKRLPGQPILTTNQVQFTYGKPPESISELRGLVCKDISGGEEDIPIPATNLVDDPPVAPTGCVYRKSIKVAPNVKMPSHEGGCKCQGTCYDTKSCSCAKLNGFDFPYVLRDGGRLIEAKDVIYECGPGCGCGPDCVNRTTQKGLRYRLEVFRTPKKGWAVRSWDFIPAGAPVCEYVGILRKTDDVDSAVENNFIFDIDCLQTMRGLEGRERRSRDATLSTVNLDEPVSESVPEYCIDAGSSGNVARYINHSCGPNLFVQCILSSHRDIKLARVVLFAADNIPPLQELTYDYGYALDSVLGPDGKVKKMACYCGAADCRKRLY